MKLSSLFNIITDVDDVLEFFKNVNNVDQLKGRLRRISQIEADDLLTCLQGLQTSVTEALDDTLEMNPDLDGPEIPDLDDLKTTPAEEKEIDGLDEPETPTEDQSPEAPADSKE